MRFNDMRVSDVTEDDAMKESVGGYANSSAYFLIYVEKSLLSEVVHFHRFSVIEIYCLLPLGCRFSRYFSLLSRCPPNSSSPQG